MAESDPSGARLSCLAVLARAEEDEVRATALHGLAISCLHLGEPAEARRWADEAIALASRACLHDRLAVLRATSALLSFHAEDPAGALAELDGALDGPPAGAISTATLYGQRAHLCFRLGRHEEGLADSDRALGALRGAPRRSPRAAESIEARVRANRALGRFWRGDYRAAKAELATALEMHRRTGSELFAAQVLDNLGCVATRLGEVPFALRCFDGALAAYVELGLPVHHVMADRAELLVAARLVPEAREALGEAAAALERAGLAADAAETLLSLARACLADHDVEASIAAAEQAEESFSRQGRRTWAVLACEAAARARQAELAERGDHLGLFASALSSARSLESAGWRREALAARVTAAGAVLEAGEADLVLAAVGVATSPSGPGSPPDRLLAAHARGLALLAGGRGEEALAALRAALSPPGGERPTSPVRLPVGDEREAARGVAATGLSIALASGEPSLVLEWAERGRLASAGLPGESGLLSQALSVLDLTTSSFVLVEFVSHRGRLLAVSAGEGGAVLHDLGEAAQVARARAGLHLALRTLSTSPSSGRPGASRRAMASLARRSAIELDARLVAPVLAARRPASRVVLVPSAGLHDVAWGTLPSLWSTALTVGPSAACRPAGARRRPGRVLVVAGPGLASAPAEAQAVASWYGAAELEVLTGPAATREAVASALSCADLAHLAVHGRFRADNASMSSLVLRDGELTVHEITSGGRRPECIVLSACDAGRVLARGGDDLAGPAPSLLAGGTADERRAHSAVVAAVAPLADRTMPVVASLLHEHLAGGRDAAGALVESRRSVGSLLERSDEELAAEDETTAVAVSVACLVAYGGDRMVPGMMRARLGES